MAGIDNLKTPTAEEAREKGRKGGLASGAARRRKKNLQEIAKAIADLPLNELGRKRALLSGVDISALDENDLTALTGVVLGQIRAAAAGDTKAAQVVAEWLDLAATRKKNRLEIEKLQAEIEAIKRRGAPADDEVFLEAWKQSIINGFMEGE